MTREAYRRIQKRVQQLPRHLRADALRDLARLRRGEVSAADLLLEAYDALTADDGPGARLH